jgi:hypothetical protein
MNWVGSGFVSIMIYAGITEASNPPNSFLLLSGFNFLLLNELDFLLLE